MNPLSASRRLAAMAGELGRHPRELPYTLRWLRSMLPGHDPLRDALPWITFRAIDWLSEYLRPGMSAFEYGAGGSTLFLAARVRRLVSVEHDPTYHRGVAARIGGDLGGRCELLLREPRPCDGTNHEFASVQARYRGVCFDSYVKAIDAYPDRSFDLVLVDGRARVACVKRALPKVAAGGAIVLDNSDRAAYADAGRLLAALQRQDLPGLTPWNLEVSQTTVWRLPGAITA